MRAHWCPERSDPEMVDTVNHYLKAFDDLPVWAVIEGIGQVAKTSTRRPPPAEIRAAARAAMEPVEKEIAAREWRAGAPERERAHRERERLAAERQAQRQAEIENGARERGQELVATLMRLPDPFYGSRYRAAQ